jgi:CheY-like chemotaxis protein
LQGVLKAFLHPFRVGLVAVDDRATLLETIREASAAGSPFDLLLFDRPEMDHGLPLALQEIRESSCGRGLPILLLLPRQTFLAGHPVQPDGVSAILARPLKQQGFLQRLDDCFGAAAEKRASPAGTGQIPSPVPGPCSPHRILVVEDNSVNQMVLQLMLKKIGFQTDLVWNGKEALAAVARQRYALVLMDCQMPEMDGYEATRLIRAMERESGGTRLPIIAVTANVLIEAREECLKAGMDGYLSKPIHLLQLENVLKSLLPFSRPLPTSYR